MGVVVVLHRLAVNYRHVQGYLTQAHLIIQSACTMDVGSMLFVFPGQLWCYTGLQSITVMYEVTLLEHISLLNQLGSWMLGQCCLSFPGSCGATQACSQLQTCTRLPYSSTSHYSISLDHGCWVNAVCLSRAVVVLHRLAVNYRHVRGYLTRAHLITQSAWIMDVGSMLFVFPEQLWCYTGLQSITECTRLPYSSTSHYSISLDHGCWVNAVRVAAETLKHTSNSDRLRCFQ
ncbi:hypothetical protein J6590_087416 [Homalodisca vitripennis]|nr:hypothetical protein J6590_087416 [Homalodisca vitripennis]